MASATEQARERTRRGERETKLAEMLAQEDYFGAAAVKEEMRAIAVAPQGSACQAQLQKRVAEDAYAPAAPTRERMRMQARPWKSTADADTEGHGSAATGFRCPPLAEKMLRICLCCLLLRRCALGDVTATGTCILWMFGLHCSTAASRRAFSMLTMLSLDARWCSPEGKVLLCVVSALAPLFPPKKNFR